MTGLGDKVFLKLCMYGTVICNQRNTGLEGTSSSCALVILLQCKFFQPCLVHIFQLVNNTAICMLFVSEYLSFLTTEI